MKLKNIYATIVTPVDIASNNRGESNGNIATMQKVKINGKEYTRVSGEAIRLNIVKNVMDLGLDETNREWVDGCSQWKDHRNPEKYFDDDVMGFLTAEAAKAETDADSKGTKKSKRGESVAKKGCLEISAAYSTTPFANDSTFNATSAKKVDSKGNSNKTSLYGTEIHGTSYQWGFALNPNGLVKSDRAVITLKAIQQLSSVAGNHSRYKFDFAPNLVALRLTYDLSPRILKIFDCEDPLDVRAQKLIKYVRYGEIAANELYVGGELNDDDMAELKALGVNCYPVPRMAFKAVEEAFAKN